MYTVTENLRRVFEEFATPLQIETVAWSLGTNRYIADQVNHENHLVQGQQLASRIAAYRRAFPVRPIYLVGHSAGCAVLLAATEALPPDAVNRMILLAPSVCQAHDLRPALRCCRSGIDVFRSDRDWLMLGLGAGIVGTTDPGCRTAAGKGGFRPIIFCPADAALYGQLRQHPWDPALEWTGNDGGQLGDTRPAFLRAYVVPLLVGQ
jgi:pimeloyl-ACP methyl ester carboxylesterase